ncbi:recombinase family protein [Brassicibacter mesophilus]|uniref:recombinase family protein n=1 Tax=Brassicibacter mesophilus TaxID=745119 RepID=UPI003D1D9AE0
MNDFFSDNYRGEIYNAAIYCRLSSEDDDKSESNSISNQKSILTKYVMEKGWNMVDIYVDDGFTGLNFVRPGFNRMLEDINVLFITTFQCTSFIFPILTI